MIIRLFLISTFFFGPLGAIPHDSLTSSNARHLINSGLISKDSLSRLIDDLQNTQTQNTKLLGILERTNEQLSLVYNPYGLMVATLGVLFTLLAITVTFLIFRQSSEYRKLIDKSILESRNIVNQFLSERKLEIEAQMDQYKKDFKTADATTKKNIETALESLEKRRQFIDTQFRTPQSFGSSSARSTGTFGFWVPPEQGYSGYSGSFTNSTKRVTCPKCQNTFDVNDSVPMITSGTFAKQRICPKCNTSFIA